MTELQTDPDRSTTNPYREHMKQGCVVPQVSEQVPRRTVIELAEGRLPPADALQPDSALIRLFLHEVLSDIALHLVAIHPDNGRIAGQWFGTGGDEATRWAAAKNLQGFNLYWTVNIVRDAGINRKCNKDEIVAARFAHVDIDPSRDGTPFDKRATLHRLESLALPPTCVIDSGNGIQAFWKLSENAVDWPIIEQINVSLAGMLDGDNCHNIDRVMRLPGTTNFPNAKKRGIGRVPIAAAWLSHKIDTAYDVMTLAKAVNAKSPAAAVTTSNDRSPNISALTLLTADDLRIGGKPLDSNHKIRLCIENPSCPDRSRGVMSCAGQMVRAGFTNLQIMGILMNPANAVSAHIREQSDPMRAANRAVSRARSGRGSRNDTEVSSPAAGTRIDAAKIKATPFVWSDPTKIPVRPWLLGKWVLRGTTTAIVAPGGVGKSTFVAAMGLSLCSGQPLLGPPVHGGPQRVWIWNLEDGRDELTRSISGAMLSYRLCADDIGDRLFVDSGLDGDGLCTAVDDREGMRIIRPVMDAIAAEIVARKISCLIVDPFVSSHQVDENNNSKIDLIVKEWARLATLMGCAIILVHHTRKPAGAKTNSESARGAVSFIDASRSALILNRMDEAEAIRFGVPNTERVRHFSVMDDKHSRSPAQDAVWYRLDSECLGNGGLHGSDSVGVVKPWSPPDPMDGIELAKVGQVQQVVSKGIWRKDPQSPAWVGIAVADVMGFTNDIKANRPRIKALIEMWLKDGTLVEVKGLDHKRTTRLFIEVGKPVPHPPHPI